MFWNPRLEAASNVGIVPPTRISVPGRHAIIPQGTLFIPDYFRVSASNTFDLVLFFHGAPWCAEQNFYLSRKNGVLLSVNAGALSSFGIDTNQFAQTLKDAATAVAMEGFNVKKCNRVCLASFSGGYVAIRNILRHGELYDQITDVLLADSLYAPRLSGATNALDSEAMKPFLDYARRAAVGKGRFIFTHLYPPEPRYRNNTTTLAAAYLIDHLDVKRRSANTRNSRGAVLLYRADMEQFHVLGYAGMTNQDHFDHFYSLSDLLKEISFETSLVSGN